MTQFKQRIEQGLLGEYQGLANGFDRINKYIYNTQRGCFTLLGGLSGSSKTTLCDSIYGDTVDSRPNLSFPFTNSLSISPMFNANC